MKNVLLFVAIITVMGSLKKEPNGTKCNPVLVTEFYNEGKLVYTKVDSYEGYSITRIIQKATLSTGEIITYDRRDVYIQNK